MANLNKYGLQIIQDTRKLYVKNNNIIEELII